MRLESLLPISYVTRKFPAYRWEEHYYPSVVSVQSLQSVVVSIALFRGVEDIMHAVVVDDVMSDHTVLTLGYVRSQGLCSRGNTGLVAADVGCIQYV